MSLLENYQQKFEAKMESWKADLDKLKAKASEAEADQKIKYHEEIKQLKSRMDEAGKAFQNLKNAGSEAWDKARKDFESAWTELTSTDRAHAGTHR